MTPKLSEKIQSIWYGRRSIIAWLLWPISLLYQTVIEVRRLLFAVKLLPVYQPQVPVIVIGNITVGGVGKTPFTAALATHFSQQGMTVGVVSRGYGGRVKEGVHIVAADADPDAFGDEPVMLAKQVNAFVVVAAKRVQAIRLCEDKGCDVILSDDGLSHYYFNRQLEVVIVDAARGLGNGFCLPAGPLRESARRLRSVDLLLKNKNDSSSNYSFCLQPQQWVKIGSGETQSIDYFSGQTVHAVSAIGNNQRFFDSLRSLGCQVIEHPFPDHYRYEGTELSFNDDLPVVVTEKDAVKLKKYTHQAVWFLRINACVHPLVYEKIEKMLKIDK